eukprot:3383176-Rhodomonas_salina.1
MAEALDARGVEGKPQVALSAPAPSHGVGMLSYFLGGLTQSRWHVVHEVQAVQASGGHVRTQ